MCGADTDTPPDQRQCGMRMCMWRPGLTLTARAFLAAGLCGYLARRIRRPNGAGSTVQMARDPPSKWRGIRRPVGAGAGDEIAAHDALIRPHRSILCSAELSPLRVKSKDICCVSPANPTRRAALRVVPAVVRHLAVLLYHKKMSGVWWPMSGVWWPMSGVWWPMSEVYQPVSEG
ncbi:hypothetical protein BJ138DRAFT_1160695 [Hygrophoropsis aurantiaca]|uniref:Uncharacterized protein n=1 Tax=Hygrophoropsis aurantiaca TaxID=72124 RepID=A0ACB8A220_9AGAM|nr:hypothetical protein BJ138DRAFT_1160695 [Hygrophoropsis aurantiaca]